MAIRARKESKGLRAFRDNRVCLVNKALRVMLVKKAPRAIRGLKAHVDS